MAKAMVFVGCRLPHGLIIEHPMRPDEKIELKGQKSAVRSEIIVLSPRDYGVTEVPGDFAEQWFAANKEFPAVVSKAIFGPAKTENDLRAMADELVKEKTGLEGMPRDKEGMKAAGFKDLEPGDKK